MSKLRIPVLILATSVSASCLDALGLASSDTYDLVRFDGADLPVELPTAGMLPADPPRGWVVRSGSFVMRSDGTCRRTVVADVPESALGPAALNHEAWWDCTWTEDGGAVALTWAGSSDPAVPLVTDSVAVELAHGAGVTLRFETLIRCVRAPCPTGWSEAYEWVGGTGDGIPPPR